MALFLPDLEQIMDIKELLMIDIFKMTDLTKIWIFVCIQIVQ